MDELCQQQIKKNYLRLMDMGKRYADHIHQPAVAINRSVYETDATAYPLSRL